MLYFKNQNKSRAAFTLMELVVVSALIATLATAVFLSVQSQSTSAKVSATANAMRMLKDAATDVRLTSGSWPAEVSVGVTPTELVDYLPRQFFRRPVPIGGAWDWNGPTAKGTIGIAIQFGDASYDPNAVQQLDKLVDDGNVDTGDGVVSSTKPVSYVLTISEK